jgi:hypothetical protein
VWDGISIFATPKYVHTITIHDNTQMLGRIAKGGQRQGGPAGPFGSLNGTRPSAPSPFDASGRRRDITFNERFLTPAPQPSIVEAIWQFKVRRNVHKAQIRNLPKAEKVRYYLENRPQTQKLLDWAASKSHALARTWGTVDAWTGPVAKSSPQALLPRANVKMLRSPGTMTGRMSEWAKRITIWGMLISMGVLTGWLMTEKTKAEGPAELVDQPDKRKKIVSVAPEDEERRPGVFIWGSNRYETSILQLMTKWRRD